MKYHILQRMTFKMQEFKNRYIGTNSSQTKIHKNDLVSSSMMISDIYHCAFTHVYNSLFININKADIYQYQ